MFLFVLYALGVWYLAIRYRRRVIGFTAVGVGLGGLLGVIYLHTRLNDWMGGTINLPVLRGLMYPYTFTVTVIGFYVACLPRTSPVGSCAVCGYSLEGLPHDEVEYCPECGVGLGARRRTPEAPVSQPRTLATLRAATRARQAEARARAAHRPETIAAR